jgi:hypothetical protein
MGGVVTAGDWKEVFEAVKEGCLVGLWSRGVELAREGKVAGETHDGEEWTFRVKSIGVAIAPTIRLYPQDAEWECDCGSQFDPCEHIAACVIAVTATPEAADDLFSSESRNVSIRYSLECRERDPAAPRSAYGVIVRRYVPAGEGDWVLLGEPLSERLAAGGAPLSVSPTREDLQIDRLIGRGVGDPLPFDRVTSLLRALVNVADLRIGEDQVRASSEPLFPQAHVADAGDESVELVVEADPSINEIFAPGILRRGDMLHPFGAQARFGQVWERLPFRREFSKREIPELVSTALPELSKHITVDVRTLRLPEKQGRVPVWIQFTVDLVDEGVDVLPLLVYDDPPVARIDSGRLVHLSGAIPMRDEASETDLRLKLRDRLNLVPGRRVNLAGTDAAKFLSDLEAFDSGRPASASMPAGMKSGGLTLQPRLSE